MVPVYHEIVSTQQVARQEGLQEHNLVLVERPKMNVLFFLDEFAFFNFKGTLHVKIGWSV